MTDGPNSFRNQIDNGAERLLPFAGAREKRVVEKCRLICSSASPSLKVGTLSSSQPRR